MRMRTDLTAAMKERNQPAVAALRSALAAIDNAEAVDPSSAPPPDSGSIAGAAKGLRTTEVARRELSDAEVARIVRTELIERRAAAGEYEERGHYEHAGRLRVEANVLASYVEC